MAGTIKDEAAPAPGPDDVKLPGVDVPAAGPDKAPAGRPRPASSSPSGGKAKRGPGRPSNSQRLESQLVQLFSTVAVAGQLATLSNETVSRDFAIVGAQAEPLAAALVKLAETNPAVRRVLDSLVQTSAYGELITVVVGGIVLPILANHGILPAFIAGTIAGAEAQADDATTPAAA